MKLGQRMIRLDDGMKGVVFQNGPELRIFYEDRGEERVAPKSEKWIVEEITQGPLRYEEMLLIARYADRALMAHELHEPHRYWEPPGDDPPYDSHLVACIIEYLQIRQQPQPS